MITPTFVIVGAGPCGCAAAAALREAGFDGALLLVGEETRLPYERPPLSKGFLRAEVDASALLIRSSAWYEENEVEVLTGCRALHVDPVRKTVQLSGGGTIPYTRLLVATGGRPRRLPSDDAGVLYLRSLDDAETLRSRLCCGRHLVLIGGGFMGSEIAASAHAMGLEVAIIDTVARPLERCLGEDIARLLVTIHEEHGVTVRTGEGVTSVGGAPGDSTLIRTSSGASIECDVVVAGLGLTPNSDVLVGTGIDLENGIRVDHRCRTEIPDIFAAGDVANHFHPIFGRHVRVEHHDNALRHGAAAGRAMLGEDLAFDDPHWFWSDQYEYNLQCVGVLDDSDQVVVRGDRRARSFAEFHLREGRVRGVAGVNRGRDILRGRHLIRGAVEVRGDELADEGVDLRSVLRRSA